MRYDGVRGPKLCCDDLRDSYSAGNVWLIGKRKLKIGMCVESDGRGTRDTFYENCPFCSAKIEEELEVV